MLLDRQTSDDNDINNDDNDDYDDNEMHTCVKLNAVSYINKYKF